MKSLVIIASLVISFNATASSTQKVEEALAKGNILDAKASYATLSKEIKQSINGKLIQGRFLLAEQQGEEAYDYFETLREKAPENDKVNYYFAVSAVVMAQQASIFSKLGYAEDFVEAIEKTLTLNPHYIDALDTAIGFYLHAPTIAGGDVDKATTYAKKLIQLSPVKGYRQLATIYRNNEQSEKAYSTLAEGLAEYPESGALYLTRAMANIESEAWERANEDLKLAVKFAQNNEDKAQALYQQGKLAAETGNNIELGINALKQAQHLESTRYKNWSHYRLAQLLVHKKDFTAAEQILNSIILKDNEKLEKKVKQLRKRLKKLMS
ncbi:tetratricopeptide repeat protein [Thalassotalea sediminis]|uniref:tetratricopeptide repeat protein n=1 Tax=Thalassotalea sediminis TaxID=1759089 RepID=UPI002572276E|nr:hypothetical protein [Thalassotalea sediminis]